MTKHSNKHGKLFLEKQNKHKSSKDKTKKDTLVVEKLLNSNLSANFPMTESI